MSNELQVIETKEILNTQVSVYGTADNPLFLAKEVADWIGHSKVSMMLEGIDEEEKLKETILTSGQNREMWFLTEDGLYEVLMQSRKPVAKQFKKEVKKILKDIRKHGMYATDKLLENPDLLISVATKYKEERTKRLLAEQRINELQPKATYYDLVLQNKSTLTVNQIAKDYGMGAIKLNRLLHELGVQYKQGKIWLLYAKHQDKGYTQSHTWVDDTETSRISTRWTQKGRLFIYGLLKNEKNLLPLIEQSQEST